MNLSPRFLLTALLVIPLQAFCANHEGLPSQLPVVVVAHDGSGDFGPETPNTRTAGIQEAIHRCLERGRDLYIKGGWRGPVYNIEDTIRIPASQDFRIDGGEYVLNWVGPATKDLLVVDSGMDCHFTFGILVYGGLGAALRVKPDHPVPIDGFPVFVDSDITASSIADPRPFERGERKGGAGVVFDTSNAPIVHCDFHFTAILNFAVCVETPSERNGFCYNDLRCKHLHTNADGSTLLRIGPRSVQNVFDVRIGVDQGATRVEGIRLNGAHNTLTINTRGGFPEGKDLIFDASAEGNVVHILQNKDPFEPCAILTDSASHPTNRVTWTGGPIPVRAMRQPAGKSEYIQRLFPGTLRFVEGRPTALTLIRGSETVDCDPGIDQSLKLSVGDKLAIRSAVPLLIKVIPE